MLSLENAAIAIASLLALSLVSGVLFAVVLQPSRSRVNMLYAAFCFTLLIWSVVALAGPLEGLRFGADDRLRVNLLASMIGASAITFYAFVYAFCEAKSEWSRWLLRLSPVIYGVALILIWTGTAFEASDPSMFAFKPIGIVAVGLLLMYGLAAFMLIMISGEQRASRLRLPGLLIVIAYVSVGIPTLLRVPVAISLMTVAAALAARMVLRFQLFSPIDDIQSELRVANRDLAQALTDLAQARAEKQVLQDELNTADRSRSEFVDLLGVKLRTPLNSIVGYSELLESGIYGELNEKQADRIAAIHRSGDVLERLIVNLLSYNTIQAGRMKLNRAPTAIRDMVERVIARNAELSAARMIPVMTELPPDLPLVEVDAVRIEQALHELVSNALQFTPQGGASSDEERPVTVRARALRVVNGRSNEFPMPVIGWLPDGEWVLIETIDRGPGIPSELQSRVFEPFYQIDPESHQGGGGLGLTVAQGLIANHQGRLWLKSSINEGTTFFAALPVKRSINTR